MNVKIKEQKIYIATEINKPKLMLYYIKNLT